jgi:hypothetical protein
VRGRDAAGGTQAYTVHFLSLRLFGNGRGLSFDALPILRAGRMERQSIIMEFGYYDVYLTPNVFLHT